MKLHHIAIWTFRLEELKEFYVRFFGGKSNEKYINPKKGFESYFISFGEGTDLELMSRTDVQNTPIEENRVGLTHFAFTFPSQEEVLRFTEQMRSEGYTIAGEPRTWVGGPMHQRLHGGHGGGAFHNTIPHGLAVRAAAGNAGRINGFGQNLGCNSPLCKPPVGAAAAQKFHHIHLEALPYYIEFVFSL